MKIVLVLDYPDVKDPNSTDADAYIDGVSEHCEEIADICDASNCWVEEAYADSLKTAPTITKEQVAFECLKTLIPQASNVTDDNIEALTQVAWQFADRFHANRTK